jgi:lipopolysaccharide heptosyltransferase I
MRLAQREFERILIIKPSSLGDVIHALPVLSGLRRRYPSARISWLVATSCAGVLEGHPALDEIIRFDRQRYGLLGRHPLASLEFARFVSDLRRRRFDLVIDLQGLFRSGFLALASGARVRVGFGNARELGWMFYSHRVAVPDAEAHAVERNLLCGRMLGLAGGPPRFELPVHSSAAAEVWAMLAVGGLLPGQEYLLVGPGTRWETKQWPAEHFAAALEHVAGRTSAAIVLMGMPSERPEADRLAAALAGRAINLAGRTSLPQVIALVAGALAVLMHDSGPMHLATALGKPTVALYGPTSERRTGPYGSAAAVARLDLPCAPCYLKKVSDCPHGHRCMRDLAPDRVAEQVLRVLEPGDSRHDPMP